MLFKKTILSISVCAFLNGCGGGDSSIPTAPLTVASISTTSQSTEFNGFSIAGIWFPVVNDSLNENYDGILASTFSSLVKIGNSNDYGLVITGWGYQGWDKEKYKSNNKAPLVNIALLEPNKDGSLMLETKKYISDPVTTGSGSVIVSDINNDSIQDMVFLSHNETPLIPAAGSIFFGSKTGTFYKRIINDYSSAHDAQLVNYKGTKKILPSLVSGHPRTAFYEFGAQDLIPKNTNNMSYSSHVTSRHLGNMTKTLVKNKTNDYVLVTGGGCESAVNYPNPCPNHTINTFSFDGIDIDPVPKQKIIPFISSTGNYKFTASLLGVNQTHVYRIWNIDLNHDGNEDILSAQSMWIESNETYPNALQVLINDGNNLFADKTNLLAKEMLANKVELDYSPTFMDIDNSGIKTLFFGKMEFNQPSEQTNYVLLNDGTGKLHVGMNKEFILINKKIKSFLSTKGYTIDENQFAKFIAVPKGSNSIGFVALVHAKLYNSESQKTQAGYIFVNIPETFKPGVDFKQDIEIKDRNNSRLIRTWAGNDIIHELNSATTTRIDGGGGTNKVIYSGNSNDYSITQNLDGSYQVKSLNGHIKVDDILINIHNVQFKDYTRKLQ